MKSTFGPVEDQFGPFWCISHVFWTSFRWNRVSCVKFALALIEKTTFDTNVVIQESSFKTLKTCSKPFSSTFPRFDLNRQSKDSQFSSTSQLSSKTVSVLGAVFLLLIGIQLKLSFNFPLKLSLNFSNVSIVFQLTVV